MFTFDEPFSHVDFYWMDQQNPTPSLFCIYRVLVLGGCLYDVSCVEWFGMLAYLFDQLSTNWAWHFNFAFMCLWSVQISDTVPTTFITCWVILFLPWSYRVAKPKRFEMVLLVINWLCCKDFGHSRYLTVILQIYL